MKQESFLYKVKHFFAVSIEGLRRPGRFSVAGYPRENALRYIEQGGLILDVGCGTRKLSEDVIAIDLTPGDCVKIVGDACHLPFADESCDGVWLEAVLEHVPDPRAVLTEIQRVLKPHGWLYLEVPFMQGEHAAPGDYQRYTKQGFEQLLKEDWQFEWFQMAAGPFSALAYHLRSCLSMITSFGNDKLYRATFEAVWGYVVWPIKWLDYLFKDHPRAHAHAFGYAMMLRKSK